MKKKLEKVILWTFGISGFLIAISMLIGIGILFLFMIIENSELLGPISTIIGIIWAVFGTTAFLALIQEKYFTKSDRGLF